jgi:hypothetical protein
MRKILALFILLLTFVSCSKSEFDLQKRKDDINSIITTIVETDSIHIAKNNPGNNKIVQFLGKIKIIISSKDRIAPLNNDEIEIDRILNFKSKNFGKSDSAYLFSQNINPDSLEIDNGLKTKYNYSDISTILKDRDNKNYYQYCEFSIPLFSKDNKTVYIEVDYHSEGYFGQGIAYVLKKENNTWKIIDKRGTWIS